jgi:translation elongation factor EF-Ts
MNPAYISSNDIAGQSLDKGEILEEQNYLMDESVTVKELLDNNYVSVIDFLRMECGEQ